MTTKYNKLIRRVADSRLTITLYLVDKLFDAIPKGDEEVLSCLATEGIKEEADIQEVISLVTNWFSDEQEQEEDSYTPKIATAGQSKNKNTIGDEYQEIFSTASFTEVCLITSDFDVEKAMDLYLEQDFRLVLRAFSLKTDLIMAEVISRYASVGSLFGGGGDSGKGTVDTIDARKLTGVITG